MTKHLIPLNGTFKKFNKPKRKIGGNLRKRSTRVKHRIKKAVKTAVEGLDTDHSAEPNDTTHRGLLGCNSIEEVDVHRAWWFEKFNGKALKALGKRVSPENRKVVEALLTQPGATSIPLLTSEAICGASYKMLHDGLTAAVRATPELEVGLVTFISGDGATSHFQTEIELHHSQKRFQATLRAMAPNFFGITELALFNSHGHPNGGQILQRHEHELIWGPPGTLEKAQDVATKHTAKFQANFSQAPVINVKRVATDELNLARVSAYLFKPPYKCMNWNPGKDGKPGHMNGDVTPAFHPAATGDRPVLSRMSAGDATGGVSPVHCCSSSAANAAGVA